MPMLRILLMGLALCAAAPTRAGMWVGLAEANHCGGASVTEADLLGKVVFVCRWSASSPDSVEALGQVQKYWDAFRGKPFAVLGSHRGGVAAAKASGIKATFPNYEGAALASGAPDGAEPSYYVVNHRGRIVYSGPSDREAIAAAEDAFFAVGGPVALTGGYVFSKKSPYRSMERQLVLGKNIKTQVARLKGDVKKAELKTATKVQRANAAEARELLNLIDAAKEECRQEIDLQAKADPEQALKLIRNFTVTFPDDGEEYRDRIAELNVLAKERAEAKKAKGPAATPAKSRK